MKLIFLASFLILVELCFSQNKDYLITQNNDTIWGKIKLKNKIFHVTGNNNIDINAAAVKKVNSSNYKGTAVVNCTLQLYNENLADLQMGWVNESAKDTVMLLDEVLLSSKINLYYGTDNFKSQYFFYQTPLDSFPIQLVVRYYLGGGLTAYNNDPGNNRSERSRVHIEEDKGYVNQLRAIMGQCNKIPEAMWENLSYRIYSLKAVIKKYNKCK